MTRLFPIVVLTLMPLGAGGQTFEAATIRPSDAGSGEMAIRHTQTRFFTVRTPVAFLIRCAWDPDPDRLIGSNSKLETAPFDIVAKIPAGDLGPGEAFKRMMQSLLAERFALRVHPETRGLTSYALQTEKGGMQVRFADPGDGIGQNPFNMTDCGRIAGTKVTAGMLAKVLASQVGRPVKDETGLSLPFDFVPQWAPEADGPSIFTALREQLGLRLDARKGAVPVMVIDSVHTSPSEN